MESTLEQRIAERVKENLGDLLSDDELQRMIGRQVEKFLFEPRVVAGTYRNEQKPPLLQEMVDRNLKERMEAGVSAWMEANPEKMQEAVEAAIKRGVGGALIDALDYHFAGLFNAGIESMRQQGMLPRSPHGP